MSKLEEALRVAFNSQGKQDDVTKFYSLFLRATLLLPIEPTSADSQDPKAIFLNHQGHSFLPVFSQQAYFDQWANDAGDEFRLLAIPGAQLIRGLSASAILCLDLGQPHYKQFPPDEIARLQSMLSKLFPAQENETSVPD